MRPQVLALSLAVLLLAHGYTQAQYRPQNPGVYAPTPVYVPAPVYAPYVSPVYVHAPVYAPYASPVYVYAPVYAPYAPPVYVHAPVYAPRPYAPVPVYPYGRY